MPTPSKLYYAIIYLVKYYIVFLFTVPLPSLIVGQIALIYVQTLLTVIVIYYFQKHRRNIFLTFENSIFNILVK